MVDIAELRLLVLCIHSVNRYYTRVYIIKCTFCVHVAYFVSIVCFCG